MTKRIMMAALAVLVSVAGAAGAFAQDIDTLVKTAVDKLAAGRQGVAEVSVSPLTIGSSDAVADLSAYLDGKIRLFAANAAKFKVVPATRGMVVAPTGRLQLGGFYTVGGKVNVTLTLTAELDGKELDRAEFSISNADLKKAGIASLPENFASQKAVEQADAVIESAPSSAAFRLELWGDKETRVYYHGEEMKLSLAADKDCFFKVYHIDVQNNMKMIYPNALDTDNRLTQNVTRVIPEKSAFKLGEPYGEETILVVANTTQFSAIEDDLASVKVSREAIAAAANASRGISVTARSAPAAQTAARGDEVSARWSYTILAADKASETVSYSRPADLNAFLDTMRRDITARGGTFKGDEKGGTFSDAGLSGSYTVSKKQIVFAFEETETQVGTTRGLADVFSFSFSKPADIGKALTQVKNEIGKSKGNFSGNEREGSFTAQGISGNYAVADTVNVSIFQKPRIIPNSMIEKEVKNYFLAK